MSVFSSKTLLILVSYGVLCGLSCGDSGNDRDCPLGEVSCNGTCVDIYTDDQNCGGCDTICTATEACTAGLCESTCLSGEIECEGSCVDPQTDPGYCGDCTTACDSDENCVAGSCQLDCGETQYSRNSFCQGCMENSCCAELAACPPDSDCAEAFDCVRLCQEDVDCVTDCLENVPDGAVAAEALVDCREQWCQSPHCDAGVCNTEFLYTAGTHPTAPSLNDCVSRHCCEAFTPCYDDADCLACLEDPETAGCDTNTLYQAARGCEDTHCARDICETSWSNVSVLTNTCWSDNCCTEWVACTEDATCSDCIGGGGTGCATNLMYTDTYDCRDLNCPQDICGTGIIYTGFFGDLLIECNRCTGDNCCGDITTCMGDGSPAASDLCLACLSDPESIECSDATVHDAAVAFEACKEAHCDDCY